MERPEIFKAHQNMGTKDSKPKNQTENLSLREFMDTYVTSLANIIKAFPKGNLDLNALEAHLWDRLKYFYQYESFRDVDIESSAEVKFINEAIKLIEDWFYGGEWTSCLVTPTAEEIQTLFASAPHNTFLQRVRGVEDANLHPNLGRDRKNNNHPPLPNIYDGINSGDNPQQVYMDHAFKFFHSPAAVANTLTKIYSQKRIVGNDVKFQDLKKATFNHAIITMKKWGYRIPPPGPDPTQISLDPDAFDLIDSAARMNIMPNYIRPKQEYKRNLFFIKTCMVAAEMIRRTGEGKLTKEGYQKIMEWLRRQDKDGQGIPDYFSFDFLAPNNTRRTKFGFSSLLHVNAKEFPFALFAVDQIRRQNELKHSLK